MEILETIKSRRSIRNFASKPVDLKFIEILIEAARMAPTAHNAQPWEFIVITDPGMRRTIAHITDYGKFIANAPICIAVFSKPTKYYIEDCCAATENILLAATGLGLGSCWVAGDKKPYCNKISGLLEAPPDYKLVSLIAVGYADSVPSIPQKRPLKEMFHREKY